MHEEQDKFEVLSGKEMREKYYYQNEAPPVIKLNPENVPASLRSLIPLAEKWGISDDILREEFVSSAAPEEVKEVKQVVNKFRQAMNEWLAGTEADNPPFSTEYLAFTHMLMAADGY